MWLQTAEKAICRTRQPIKLNMEVGPDNRDKCMLGRMAERGVRVSKCPRVVRILKYMVN